ncbi:hypothetical protein HDU88_004217 [Geranomyces variabilis]|nr:hypothetical protein HDU88_004217 [Geranomyces variabilis]
MVQPPPPKHLLAVQQLRSPDPQDRSRAVRFIKNCIIGNRTKKDLYLGLGVATRLVEFLSDPQCDVELRVQVAVVLGSFAYGNDCNIRMLVDAGAITPLLGTLAASDLKLVEAGARALKAIFQSSEAPLEEVFQGTYVKDLIRLLTPTPALDNSLHSASSLKRSSSSSSYRVVPEHVTEVAAGIVAKIAVARDAQMQIAHAGAVPLLCALLSPRRSPSPKLQEAALDALANLCRDNPVVAATVVACPVDADDPNSALTGATAVRMVRDRRPVMRLLAATCLTNIYRAGALPAHLAPDAVLTLLPALIKLFTETAPISALYGSGWATVQEKAPKVFADLVEASEDMQKAAMEADAVAKLAAVVVGDDVAGVVAIEEPEARNRARRDGRRRAGARNSAKEQPPQAQPSPPPRVSAACGHAERVTEGFLRAIAAVCSLKEECRKQVIDAKLLPPIVASMSHPSRHVRAAACACARSLSRSVKNLRTALVDAGVAQPLFALLADDSRDVRLAASATVCNVVLDFSPMKRIVVEGGGVERLAGLVGGSDEGLRLNAVWALKNLLFMADPETKARVMDALGWNALLSLIDDPHPAIQEQALNLLRNLACGKESDIDAAFAAIGARTLLDLVERKLDPSVNGDDVVLQALYVVVNVATGSTAHKRAVMDREGVLRAVWEYMTHAKSAIRVATVWTLINLTWPDDPGAAGRVAQLSRLGFEPRLRAMVTGDVNADVKDRVKTALENFEAGTGGGGGSSGGNNSQQAPGDGAGGVVAMEGVMRAGSGAGAVVFGSLEEGRGGGAETPDMRGL